MSLYTITFEETDSDLIEPKPVQLNGLLVVQPPKKPNINQRKYRRRLPKHPDDDDPVNHIKTEKVDIYGYGSDSYSSSCQTSPKVVLPNDSFVAQQKCPRRRRRLHNEQVENDALNTNQNEQNQQIKLNRRRRLKNTQENAESLQTNHEEQQENTANSENEIQEKSSDQNSDESRPESANSTSSRSSVFDDNEDNVDHSDNTEQQNQQNQQTEKKNQIVNIRSPIRGPKLIKYKFDFENKMTLKGTRINMQLSLDGDPLYHSKIKGRKNVDEVPINKGTQCHFSEEHDGVLLVTSDNKSFSLREKTRYGQELCTIRFHIDLNEKKPRICHMHCFGDDDIEVPSDIQSRAFIHKPDGQWMLKLSNRSAISSIKNCVLVDENDVEWMVVLKTAKTTMTIEASPKYSPMEVFAMGIASYLCK